MASKMVRADRFDRILRNWSSKNKKSLDGKVLKKMSNQLRHSVVILERDPRIQAMPLKFKNSTSPEMPKLSRIRRPSSKSRFSTSTPTMVQRRRPSWRNMQTRSVTRQLRVKERKASRNNRKLCMESASSKRRAYEQSFISVSTTDESSVSLSENSDFYMQTPRRLRRRPGRPRRQRSKSRVVENADSEFATEDSIPLAELFADKLRRKRERQSTLAPELKSSQQILQSAKATPSAITSLRIHEEPRLRKNSFGFFVPRNDEGLVVEVCPEENIATVQRVTPETPPKRFSSYGIRQLKLFVAKYVQLCKWEQNYTQENVKPIPIPNSIDGVRTCDLVSVTVSNGEQLFDIPIPKQLHDIKAQEPSQENDEKLQSFLNKILDSVDAQSPGGVPVDVPPFKKNDSNVPLPDMPILDSNADVNLNSLREENPQEHLVLLEAAMNYGTATDEGQDDFPFEIAMLHTSTPFMEGLLMTPSNNIATEQDSMLETPHRFDYPSREGDMMANFYEQNCLEAEEYLKDFEPDENDAVRRSMFTGPVKVVGETIEKKKKTKKIEKMNASLGDISDTLSVILSYDDLFDDFDDERTEENRIQILSDIKLPAVYFETF